MRIKLFVLCTLWLSISAFAEPEAAFIQTKAYEAKKLGEGHVNVALFGDSLSHDFFTAQSDLDSVRQMTTKRQGNWFLTGLHDRLAKDTEVRSQIFARVSAYIKANNETPRAKKLFASVQDLHEQIDSMLSEKTYPNLILSWIGHNNLDWNWDIVDKKASDAEKHREAIPEIVAKAYRGQIERLVAGAAKQEHPVVIVVYGLGNMPSLFDARREAKAAREKDKMLYPSFEMFYQKFTSFTPEYENVTTAVWRNTNTEIAKAVKDIDTKSKRVKVIYSPAFAEIKIEKAHLHEQDGFHLSKEGHEHFSKTAHQELKDVLPLLKK